MSVLISTYWHPQGVPIKQSLPNFWALWVYSRMTKILCAELWWLFWQIWRSIKSLTVSQSVIHRSNYLKLEKCLNYSWHLNCLDFFDISRNLGIFASKQLAAKLFRRQNGFPPGSGGFWIWDERWRDGETGGEPVDLVRQVAHPFDRSSHFESDEVWISDSNGCLGADKVGFDFRGGSPGGWNAKQNWICLKSDLLEICLGLGKHLISLQILRDFILNLIEVEPAIWPKSVNEDDRGLWNHTVDLQSFRFPLGPTQSKINPKKIANKLSLLFTSWALMTRQLFITR